MSGGHQCKGEHQREKKPGRGEPRLQVRWPDWSKGRAVQEEKTAGEDYVLDLFGAEHTTSIKRSFGPERNGDQKSQKGVLRKHLEGKTVRPPKSGSSPGHTAGRAR